MSSYKRSIKPGSNQFLQTGYRTFRQIPDIEHFLDEIEVRAIEVFERIYTAPLEKLR